MIWWRHQCEFEAVDLAPEVMKPPFSFVLKSTDTAVAEGV